MGQDSEHKDTATEMESSMHRLKDNSAKSHQPDLAKNDLQCIYVILKDNSGLTQQAK